MAVEQTRPYEEGLYDQGLDPSTVMIIVDNSAWSRPKRLPLSYLDTTGGTGGAHIEKDRLTGLSSRTVEVEFDLAFSSIPVGDVKCYRMYEQPDGTFQKQDVIWGFTDANQPTISGFTLTISTDESLTGVIIEYSYM
jgi:hypothetical protein